MATASPILAPEPIDKPDGLYEVVDGHFLEKEMGVFESEIAAILYDAIKAYLSDRPLGKVTIEYLFLLDTEKNLRRRPDVAFISAARWPIGKRAPREAAWNVVPDLAIEVLSPGNRTRDDARKLEEYFRAGVRLVWFVNPESSRVYVHTHDSPLSVQILPITESLDGGDVLPGFRLPLAELFAEDEGEEKVRE